MSKRSAKFERRDNDFYPTPEKPVLPLLRYLEPKTRFWEPCAGDASLAAVLVKHGHSCRGMSDKAPQHPAIAGINALQLGDEDVADAHCFITNPPWEVDDLHPLIDHLKWLKPTWMLLYFDWLATQQAAEYLPDATHIVPVGRVRWIPGTDNDGMDNCCWVRFVGGHDEYARFYPYWG
jgi:hypothetical protein